MFKYVSAALAGVVLFSAAATAQVQLLTNYQVVSASTLANGAGKVYVTYKADLVNVGPPEASVTATINTLDPFTVRVAPGQGTLNFGSVKANSVTTSTNTFTLIQDPNVPLDPNKLNVVFRNGPAAPIANPGPNLTAQVGTTVLLDGTGSSNPSGLGGPLTYFWMFISRPPGTVSSRIFYEQSPVAFFSADAPGVYVIQLTVSNGVSTSRSTVSVTVM